jgi:integrase
MPNVHGPKTAQNENATRRQPGLTYARVRHCSVSPLSVSPPDQADSASEEMHHAHHGTHSVHMDAEYHLKRDDLERLIGGATNERDQALITLFVETGIRRFEAADLLAADLDSEAGVVIVRSGKGGKLRTLPLSDRVLSRLKSIRAPHPDSPLFASVDGSALSTRQINRIIAAAGKRAEVKNPNPRQKNVTCHLLRHSFARHWKEVGGSIETLAKILGHASVKTTWDLYGTQSVEDVIRNYHNIIKKITDPKKGEAQ